VGFFPNPPSKKEKQTKKQTKRMKKIKKEHFQKEKKKKKKQIGKKKNKGKALIFFKPLFLGKKNKIPPNGPQWGGVKPVEPVQDRNHHQRVP